MPTPAPGQRGSFTIHADEAIPAAWAAYGDATVINFRQEVHEFLPDQQANNAVQRVLGAVTEFSGSMEGTIDVEANLDLSDRFSVGAYTAKQLLLELATGTNFRFDALITDITMDRRGRQLERFTANWTWDGVSTIETDV